VRIHTKWIAGAAWRLAKKDWPTRDRRVIGRFTRAGLPVAITMAGGYAPDVQDIVDIHFGTIETAIEAISQ
jgi:acetoin utilization deacetylase AcuC-like enzyme